MEKEEHHEKKEHSAQEKMELLNKYIGIEGEKQDYKKIFPIAKELCDKGDAEPAVEYLLAKAYLYGLGVAQDIDEAIKHYEIAAKGGFKAAKEQCVHIKKEFIKAINIDEEKAIEIFDYKHFKKKPISMRFTLITPEDDYEWTGNIITNTVITAACFDTKCPYEVKVKSIDVKEEKYEFEVKLKEAKQFTALI